MKKVELTEKFEIEEKRLYIPHTIEVECPCCGHKTSFLGDDYLSYPVVNDKEKVYGNCPNPKCQEDLEIEVVLGMTISYDPSSIKKQ